MLGWLTQKTHHTSWRAFSGFGQRLLVANANNDTAEHTLGVDLIYYNVNRGSIILVQYKKLNAKNKGSFYPDSEVISANLVRTAGFKLPAGRSGHFAP